MNNISILFSVLGLNLITLLIPAIKLNSIHKLFNNPAFILGDFFILPLTFLLILNFNYKFEFSVFILILSIIYTIASGIKFNLLKIYWVPHGIFHIAFTYLVIDFFKQAFMIKNFLVVIIISFLIFIHYLLGFKFNKSL